MARRLQIFRRIVLPMVGRCRRHGRALLHLLLTEFCSPCFSPRQPHPSVKITPSLSKWRRRRPIAALGTSAMLPGFIFILLVRTCAA